MTKYEIHPLPMHRNSMSEGYMTYLMNYDVTVSLTVYSWYIKGPSKNVLVDTGCPHEIIEERRPGGDKIATFEKALERVNLKPEDIDIVIQTQLHYDHCGNTSKCSNAEVIVQKKELDFGLAPHPLFAGLYDRAMFSRLRLRIVEGDTNIDDGITLLYTPGHSPGGQSVAVRTAKGTAIITGFCCNMHAFVMPEEVTGYKVRSLDELEAMWPVRAPGIHVNPLQAFDSALRVKGLADIIIPIHDSMFEMVEKIPE